MVVILAKTTSFRRGDASCASVAAPCVPAIGCTVAPPMSAAHEPPSRCARRGRHPADHCSCGHSHRWGVCHDGRGGWAGEPVGNSVLHPTSQRARARATRQGPHGLSRACVRAGQPQTTAARSRAAGRVPRAARSVARAASLYEHSATAFSTFSSPALVDAPAARPAGRPPPCGQPTDCVRHVLCGAREDGSGCASLLLWAADPRAGWPAWHRDLW